jgi:molecular chaperone DnaK
MMKALKMRSCSTTTINIELARKDGYSSDALESLVVKGTPLPAQGSTRLRAGRDVRGGDEGHILCELYQQAEGVPEPDLNLSIRVQNLTLAGRLPSRPDLYDKNSPGFVIRLNTEARH